jgi:hypothetical protein
MQLPVLTGARLSSLARCPRQAAYQALGQPAADPPPEWSVYLNRGRIFESYVALQYEAKYGKDNVERQREIPWGSGWHGHADIYLPAEKTIVEILSAVAPAGEQLSDKIRQVRSYLLFDPEAEKAVLHVINPSSLRRDDVMPIALTPDSSAEILERVSLVQRAVDSNGTDMPSCVCDTPTACRYRGCGYTDIAWQNWTPPEPSDLPDEARLLAADLYAHDQAVKDAKAALDAKTDLRQQTREQLRDLLQPGQEYQAGPLVIKRIEVTGRRTFNITAAEASGVFHDELLAQFSKQGESHDRWYLKRVDDEPLLTADDFGEAVPF